MSYLFTKFGPLLEHVYDFGKLLKCAWTPGVVQSILLQIVIYGRFALHI